MAPKWVKKFLAFRPPRDKQSNEPDTESVLDKQYLGNGEIYWKLRRRELRYPRNPRNPTFLPSERPKVLECQVGGGKGAEAPFEADQSSSPFMRLPAEIRHAIYEL